MHSRTMVFINVQMVKKRQLVIWTSLIACCLFKLSIWKVVLAKCGSLCIAATTISVVLSFAIFAAMTYPFIFSKVGRNFQLCWWCGIQAVTNVGTCDYPRRVTNSWVQKYMNYWKIKMTMFRVFYWIQVKIQALYFEVTLIVWGVIERNIFLVFS